MDNTKIEWADMTWNPVTGCRHGCPYCYARRTAQRFQGISADITQPFHRMTEMEGGLRELEEPMKKRRQDGKIVPAPYPFGFEPTFHRYRLCVPARKQKPRNIFVCSMADLFGKWVPTRWIMEVLDACLQAPWHNYLFLTKNPSRYLQLNDMALLPRQNNFWYGTTATQEGQPYFFSEYHKTFVSVEPMTGPLLPSEVGLAVDWVIVGAETGPRPNKVVPKREWVQYLADSCRLEGVPLFMKDNILNVWGGPPIREVPEELQRRQE